MTPRRAHGRSRPIHPSIGSALLLGAAAALLAPACILDRSGTGLGAAAAGGGGAAGGEAAGGSGGCTVAEDCPDRDTACATRTCDDGICGVDYAEPNEPCADSGGDVCDGAGSCVKSDGLPCGDAFECLSGHCYDGVCCNARCDGLCETCDSDIDRGRCLPHDPATDPDDECSPGDCDGSRGCAAGGYAGASRYGDGAADSAWSVAVDAAGNAFVVGNFTGNITFGSYPLTGQGGWDVFVTKLSPSGAVLWAKGFGDGGDDYARGVAVDPAGNVIVVGHFDGAINFGNGDLPSAGGLDVFVAKFDTGGNHLHSNRFGQPANQWAFSVAADSTGAYAVVGNTEESFDFGAGSLTYGGDLDGFVVKFDGTDTAVWSRGIGDGAWQWCDEVVVDANDDVIVGGEFGGTVDFGNGALSSADALDIFVARLYSNGTHAMSTRFGSTGDQWLYALAVDPGDHILLGGHFWGTVNFGGSDLTDAGNGDAYVAKIDEHGNHLWSQRFGDASGEQGVFGLGTDGSGNVLLVGDFQGDIDLGGGWLGNAGGWDVFAAKLAVDGTHLWSRGFGSNDDQWGNDAAVDPDGNLWFIGNFIGSIDFGGGALNSAGNTDVYVATLEP